MGTGNASVSIDRPSEAVWAVIGDFGGIGGWMPGIDSCRVEGGDRILETMGMTITEHLVKKDDAARALTYSIVEGAPVERHEAVITVTPDGEGSRVTWEVEATPDEMAGLMAGIYQQALDALKSHLEQ
jgi:carbon monoxide dehydrogenase subunit G